MSFKVGDRVVVVGRYPPRIPLVRRNQEGEILTLVEAGETLNPLWGVGFADGHLLGFFENELAPIVVTKDIEQKITTVLNDIGNALLKINEVKLLATKLPVRTALASAWKKLDAAHNEVHLALRQEKATCHSR